MRDDTEPPAPRQASSPSPASTSPAGPASTAPPTSRPPFLPPSAVRKPRRTAPRLGMAGWLADWRFDARRIWPVLVVVAGLLILAVGIAVGLTLRTPSNATAGAARHPSGARGAGGAATANRNGKTSGASGNHVHRTRSTRPSTPKTTPTKPPSTSATPGTPGGPRLASASPSGGQAGQSVVIDGTGLFSSNGQVVAYFGGSAAPTSCSSQTSCTVTVPDLGGHPTTVDLTVVTAKGRSNGLRFSYR